MLCVIFTPALALGGKYQVAHILRGKGLLVPNGRVFDGDY